MTPEDKPEGQTTGEKLAQILKQKRAQAGAHKQGVPGRQSAERNAAAASASKSKPAPRKG